MIQSKNEYSLKNSVGQLKGSVRKNVQQIREKLLYHIAYIESALDDPEHYDLTGYSEELEQIVAEEKEKIREKNEVLIIKSVMASIALGEAAATALKNGHANGETEAALEYARKIKHEQKDFLTEQGIKGIYE